MTIQLTAPIFVAGAHQPIGTSLTLNAAQEAELVNRGVADYVGDNPATGGVVPANLATDSADNVSGLVGLSGKILPLSSQSIGSRAIVIGTSISNSGFGTNYFESRGWFVPMNITLGWPITTLINAAVSGQNTGNMLANWDTTVANQYDNFDVAFIEVGPNDANGISGPTVAKEVTVSNLEAMAGKLLGNGKPVVFLTPTPATTHTLASELDHLSYVTAWIKTFSENNENVFVADAGRAFVDPSNGYPNTTMAPDGTHPGYPGSAVIGKAAANAISKFIRPVSRASSMRRDHREYANNPFFNGAYATGVRGYQAGTGVTGSGPESTTVGVAGGTFTSVAVSKGSSLDNNSSPLIITASGASANWACVVVRVGSSDAALPGTAVRGRHDTIWAASTVYTVGDYALLPGGSLCCVAVVAGDSGTSGTVQPAPTTYGEIVTDNGVIWMYQKLPAVGDVMYGESEYSITSLTGGIAPAASVLVARTDGENFGKAEASRFDISGGFGSPPTTWPLSGRVITPRVTLASPGAGIAVRNVWFEWRFYFTSGGGATITIPYASVRMV